MNTRPPLVALLLSTLAVVSPPPCPAAAPATAPTAAPSTPDAALWRPRLPTPAIVALDSPADREFTAEFRATPAAKNWSASIANDLKSWPCEVVRATYAKIKYGNDDGWRVTVRVPADAPPELFDLTVACDQATAVQRQSVSVIPKFDEDFYLLHLSDEQIVNDKHTDPSGQYYRGVGTADEMYWMQEPINLIHPRLCFVTGDEIDYNGALDGWNNWHNWGYEPAGHKIFSVDETLGLEKRLSEMYLDCHRGYRVPYVECPGNHDVTPANKPLKGHENVIWHPYSVKQYETYFGQRSWSLRMGDFYLLMHDWSDRDLQKWSTAEYARALADPSIHFRMVGQHYVKDKSFDSFEFVPDQCDLMLVGHGHTVKTVRTSPYFIYEDGPTFYYGTSGFFNFRRTPTGWTCDQTASGERDPLKTTLHLFTAHGQQKKVRTDQPDPMKITADSVTVTNDLPQEFYDGRVRFLLPKGRYTATENGTILAQYDCENDTKTAVLVKVAIPASGSVTVRVAPAK